MAVDPRRYRIAVIGCGYVGTALSESLVDAGHDVTGTTTTPARMKELRGRGITPVLANVFDREHLQQVLRDRDAVYLTLAPKNRPRNYHAVYLEGARNLLIALQQSAVRRVIYTSSTRVYGQDDGQWVDEASPAEPTDERGRILREAERALLEHHERFHTSGGPGTADGATPRHRQRGTSPHGEDEAANRSGGSRPLCVTVVRLSGIYGPQRDPAARIRSLAGSDRDDGERYVNLIHLSDIVSALTGLLEVDYQGVLNLSDDRPTRRRDYYDGIVQEAGLEAIRWRTPSRLSQGKRVGNRRIKQMLGLKLQFPFH